MRKLFLILLLAVLPLQYAWSAAAAYCGHEQEQSQHFGHHAHQHNAQAGAHDGDDASGDGDGAADGGGHSGKPPGNAKVHADCAVCHHAVQASILAGMATPPDTASAGYPPSSDLRFTSHIADGPKKPDWHPAA
ncbi:hypothetical protein ASD15_08155 [Massilia sp. Root351]|jgi:hypothetical protein|uniref:hypothetical protein n=1 Tax=Massilia sp. Root351 TaxID=1736522 RepID=UPI0007093AC6|nr:hypothetical protein [Massilia sp. Root351]KQV85084.1 hypothetical protein ASD15_08155 [Massilia sp. Root351]